MVMEQDYVFKFNSSLHHYTAERFIVRCFDDRFRPAIEAFLAYTRIKHFDPESVAGGVKIFASPEEESDREYMLRELEKSIRLHKTSQIMLFSHHDCGAYGGFEKFDNDHKKELEFHAAEHKKAHKVIWEKFLDFQIESFFIDDKGIIKLS